MLPGRCREGSAPKTCLCPAAGSAATSLDWRQPATAPRRWSGSSFGPQPLFLAPPALICHRARLEPRPIGCTTCPLTCPPRRGHRAQAPVPLASHRHCCLPAARHRTGRRRRLCRSALTFEPQPSAISSTQNVSGGGGRGPRRCAVVEGMRTLRKRAGCLDAMQGFGSTAARPSSIRPAAARRTPDPWQDGPHPKLNFTPSCAPATSHTPSQTPRVNPVCSVDSGRQHA
jgi:hypothetical protein